MSTKVEKLLEDMNKKLDDKMNSLESGLEQLTRIVGETNKRVSNIEFILLKHEERFDKIDVMLLKHEERFDKIDVMLLKHEERFDKIDVMLLKHEERFDKIETVLFKHEERFDKIDNTIEKLTELAIATHEDVQDLKEYVTTHTLNIENRLTEHAIDIKVLKKAFIVSPNQANL